MKNQETKPNNQNAFPTMEHGFYRTGCATVSTYEGMTLRDYFAAKAMQSILSAGLKIKNENEVLTAYYYVAKNAYLIADEMLKQREL